MAKGLSAAVLAGRTRRGGTGVTGQAARNVREEWYIKDVSNKVAVTMKGNVRLATHYLKNKVVQNIGRPVTKLTGPRGGRVVTDRSVAGEFPKAEFTHLMKNIFEDVRQVRPGVFDGYVGTPLDYGAVLELRMDRSFLVRTLREETPVVKRLLTRPIKA